MKNKQGTQNITNFLDFLKKKKNPKWQYNQNLSNENSSFPVILAYLFSLIDTLTHLG